MTYRAISLVISLAVTASGCASVQGELTRDRRDAPWDPPAGRVLFEQLPAWDGAASKICCSSLSRDLYLKERCDTDRPRPPRSNRC